MKKIAIWVAMTLLSAAPAFAQGADAFPFTRIERDPAASAMAGASVSSTASPAWSAFRNAAVLPLSEKTFDVAVGYQLWAPDMAKANHINAGLSYKLSERFGLSLGFASQTGESYDNFVDNGEISGSITPKDLLVAVGAGFSVSDRLALGINARFVNQKLGPDDSFTGFSGDLFAQFQASEALSLTAGLSTLGSSIESATKEKFSQPASILVAGSYGLALAEDHQLDAYLNADYYFSGNYGVALGAEYTWKGMVSARAGYRIASEEAVIPSHLGLGVGVKLKGARLDVSYLTASDALANTLCFGVGFSF